MKPSPLEHLPRRSMFADVNDNTVHAPKPVNDIIVHAQKPEPSSGAGAPKGVRLEFARAVLGSQAVEPPPPVDETKTRGRGRPKIHEDRAVYRAEYMRKRRAEKRVGGKAGTP